NPNPQSIQCAADIPTNMASSGQGLPHCVWRGGGSVDGGNPYTGQYSISGGGTSGGISNNIYSFGGVGGNGVQGFDGHPFSLPGTAGGFRGGGCGGGVVEN